MPALFAPRSDEAAPPRLETDPIVLEYLKSDSVLRRPEFKRRDKIVPLMDFGCLPKIDSSLVRKRLAAAFTGLSPDQIAEMPRSKFAQWSAALWDGMVQEGAIKLDDGTAQVVFSQPNGAESVRSGILEYRLKPTGGDKNSFGRLRQTDPRLTRLLGMDPEYDVPQICGPVCVVNLAERLAARARKHPYEALRDVLKLLPGIGVTLKRQLDKWLQLPELEKLTQNYLENLRITSRISTFGAAFEKKKVKSKTDITSDLLLSANRTPLIAFIRIDAFPNDDYWTEERMTKAWHVSTGQFGHFILVENVRKNARGELEAFVNDPLVRKNYTAVLKPLHAEHLGYDTFRLVRPKWARAHFGSDDEFAVLTSVLSVETTP
ncbi:MAG: hypothetical protein WC986_05100 [Elusimicrobiota bacterium]